MNKTKTGFTVVEVLICLVLMALLLTAVAVAFNAAAFNFDQNKESFQTINAARMSLTRIASQLRTASVVYDDPVDMCGFKDQNGNVVAFKYDSATKMLNYESVESGTTQLRPLCENVTAMTFTKNKSGATINRVQISMTIASGSTTQTVSTAVTLRKTL